MFKQPKVVGGTIAIGMLFATSQIFAQGAAPAVAAGADEMNIVSALLHQILNNPASMTVIPALCVFAWLCDDLPFINSKYVAHLTVLAGALSYWMFAGIASVPKNFPSPPAVLAVNGIMCGFVAFIVHRQVVARAINFVRIRGGSDAPAGNTTLLRAPSEIPAVIVNDADQR